MIAAGYFRVAFVIFMLSALIMPAPAKAGGATPQLTIKNIQTAIADSNADFFEEQVKIENIVGSVIDFMRKDAKNSERTTLPPLLALMLSSIGDNREARNKIVSLFASETKEFVRYGINSGAFAGKKPSSSVKPGGMLAPLFANASLGRKEISTRGGETPLASRPDLVVLPVNVYDYDSGQNYPVDAVFRKTANGWIFEDIANIDQLYKKIRGEAGWQ